MMTSVFLFIFVRSRVKRRPEYVPIINEARAPSYNTAMGNDTVNELKNLVQPPSYGSVAQPTANLPLATPMPANK